MERRTYVRRYPDYCRYCDGWGVFVNPGEPLKLAECVCLQTGLCPRCGAHLDRARYVCESCDWIRTDEDRGMDAPKVIGQLHP